MISDFKKFIEKNLQYKEKLEKYCIISSFDFLNETFLLEGAHIFNTNPDNKALAYLIGLTNQRVFIGKSNLSFNCFAYDVFNITDIKVVDSYIRKKKISKDFKSLVFYFCAILPVLFCIFILCKILFVKLSIIDNISPLLGSVLVLYGLYRLIASIGYPRLVIEITLENDTKITFPVRRIIYNKINKKFKSYSKIKKVSCLDKNPFFDSKGGVVYK